MGACSSACTTGPHETYGACLRAKRVAVQWLGGTGNSYTDEKKFFQTNDRFRSAVRQGVMPEGVSNGAVDRALRQADTKG